MRASGVGLIIWITQFSATVGRPVCPRRQLNHCWGLTSSSPRWEREKNECPHHRFILLSLKLCRVNRCYIRLRFLKRCPLVSSPPKLTTLSVTKRWPLGFQKLTKPMGKKSQLDVSFWGATCNHSMEGPFEHFLSNKNVSYHENKQTWKEKNLNRPQNSKKNISNWWPHTPHEQFLFLWFLRFWSHAILVT